MFAELHISDTLYRYEAVQRDRENALRLSIRERREPALEIVVTHRAPRTAARKTWARPIGAHLRGSTVCVEGVRM